MLESGGKITEAVIIDGVRQEMIYWERKREGLEMSVVDNIREIIMLRKYDLRRGYAIFQNTLVEDETQLCQLLCRCKFSCRMQSRPTSTPYRPLKLLTWSESS